MMGRLLPFTRSPSMSRDVKSVRASNTPYTHHTFIVFFRRIQLQSFEDFSMTELSPLLIHSLPSVNENALDQNKSGDLKYDLKYWLTTARVAGRAGSSLTQS